MPVVLRIDGKRFFFYSNESQEPPHIHVQQAEKETKFWLEPVLIAFKRRSLTIRFMSNFSGEEKEGVNDNAFAPSSAFLLNSNNKKFLAGESEWTTNRMESATTLLWCLLFSVLVIPCAYFAPQSYGGPFESYLRENNVVLTIIFSVVCFVCVLSAQLSYWNQSQIARKRFLIIAHVLSWEKITHNETWGIKVSFEFETPDGRIVKGQQEGPNLPEKGQTVEKVWVAFFDANSFIAL